MLNIKMQYEKFILDLRLNENIGSFIMPLIEKFDVSIK